jgi:F-type H+-transporting ATPase subunit b
MMEDHRGIEMRLRRDIAAVLVALLTTPVPLFAAEEGGGAGLFSINGGLMIWTIVLFLLLLGVLRKYAWGPILAALDAREEGIQGALDKAANEREEAQRLLAEHKAALADSRKEAQQILADAKAAGEQIRKDIEEKARVEAQGMVESARKEIVRERNEALDSIRQESVDLALAAASRLLQERLDDDRDRTLVQNYLSGVGPAETGAEA